MAEKNFKGYSILFCIIGILCMFFYSGLQNDHLNILTPFAQQHYGWDATKATNPSTWGSMFTIIFYLITGACLVKYGVRKFMVPCTILLGLSCFFIAFNNGNYTIYTIGLFIVRSMVVPLQMGGFMLAANWFIKYRGRVMGIITAGSPLVSVVGMPLMTKVVTVGGGITPMYVGIGIVILVLAVFLGVFMRDKPEDVGLNPDGVDHHTADFSEREDMKVGEVLSNINSWKLIVSFGILQFVINAMMSSMALRYFMLNPPDVQNPAATWLHALPFLALGALVGIPVSFVLGWVDDKLGSIKAAMLLNVLYLFAVVPMWLMPVGGSVPMMLCWAFGVACMTGGMPTMHPCITAYVFGRKKYQAANKWIMTIQAIPFAFSVIYMTKLFDMHMASQAYIGLLVLLVIAFITLISMLKLRDANEADRAYVGNAAAVKN